MSGWRDVTGLCCWHVAGHDNTQIAEELGVGRVQVGRWRARYAQEGMAGIERDLPRGGRHSTVDEQEIYRLTTQTLPEHPTHWSTRTMAQVAGVACARTQAAPRRDLQGFAGSEVR